MSILIGARLRTFFAIVLMIAMVSGNVISPTSTAAQGQSVQSQLTGVTIAYGPPYVLQADLGYVDENLEMITFLGAADLLSIGFMSPLIDLNSARDIMLEGMFGEGVNSAGIERGDYTGVSYSLDMMNLDGSEMGVFSLFMNNRPHGFAEFYIFIAPPSLFAATMQTAQNTVTIGGSPLLNGVDSTVMGNMVIANIGITGGTAVTNVTDVAGQTNTTETTRTTNTNNPTSTTRTTATDTDARATYLAAVRSEYESANAEFSLVIETLDALSNQVMTNDQARPVFDAAHLNLAGTFERASAIQPPAEMEGFHQEFLAWAQAMTDMGNGWATAMSSGDTSAYGGVFETAINVHTSFGIALETEINASPTTQAPEQPTPSTSSTQTTQSTGTDPDARASYLQAVQAEFMTVNQALTDFGTVMEALGNETTTIEAARPIANGAMETLAGTTGRASAIQPPVGMESFHQEFLTWAAAMTNVGTVWADFVAGTATAEDHSAAFSQAIEIHNTFANTMVAALEARSTQTTNTPAQPTQTTQPTTGSLTDAGARETYLAAVQAEYESVTGELGTVLDTLEAMTNETLSAADAVPILDASHEVLAGTSDRAAAIQAPAGMEAFHQQFLAWAQTMTDLGLGWADGRAAGNLDAYNDLFGTALEAHTSFAIALETELNSTGSEPTGQTNTTETTTRTTRSTRTTTAETPVATEVTLTTGSTNTSGADERAAYLQAVRAEYDAVDEQVGIIFSTLDEVAAETMQGDEAVAILDGTTVELYKIANRVDLMQPPAGMEAFHESFLAWQQTVIATGDAWIQFIDQGADFGVYTDALSALLAAHVEFGATLELEESGVGGTTSVQSDETPVATETTATSRTTRTTRTTAAETATVAPATTTRTTRTTRSTTATSTGNSSETSGNAGSTAADGNEWLMPENGVTITWLEPFVPDESDGAATESDPAAQQDVIHLLWEPAAGVSEDLTVTVMPPESGDAAAVVSALEADDTAAAEIFGEGSDLVLSVVSPEASAALIKLNIPQADLWVFIQYTCLDASCNAMSVVLIVSGPENLPSLLADLEQGVAIDGIAITNAIPVSDIEDSLSPLGN